MLSRKTLVTKADREAPETKICKEHVTVLTCANASGSFWLPLLVTGKLVNPRALKNYNFWSSVFVYKNQESSWMDVQLFQDCFFEELVSCVKNSLSESGLPEKALLLGNNTPLHPATISLHCEGIIVKFLPFNIMSIVQPIDPVVIVSFNWNYQKNLLHEILLNCDKKYVNLVKCLKNITMKNVIFLVTNAWNTLKLFLKVRPHCKLPSQIGEAAGWAAWCLST